MKRIISTLKADNQLQLVKGCPTDWNHDGYDNDDYNQDGETDQDDHDYYDGYMDGYDVENDYDPADHSDAYNAGVKDGVEDIVRDTVYGDDGNYNGQDINYSVFGELPLIDASYF